jgi:hypothetical protein
LRTSIGTVRQPDQGRWVDAVLDVVRGGLAREGFDRELAVGRGLDSGAVAALCVRYRD